MSSIKTTQIDGDVSVGRNVATGGNASIAGGCVIDHDLQVKGWLNAPNIKSSCKGLFLSSLTLISSYPTASYGDWALVKPSGSGDVFPAELWLWSEESGWYDSGETTEGYETFDIAELRSAVEALEEDIEEQSEDILTLQNEVKDIPSFDTQNQTAIITEDDFINVGFVRKQGTVSDSSSYRYTGFVNVEGLTSIQMHTKTGAATVSPAVFFSDQSFDSIIQTGEDGNTQEQDYDITVPTGAKYMVSSALFTFLDQTDNFSCVSTVKKHVSGLALIPHINLTQIFGETFDFAGAIARVPESMQLPGIILSFVNANAKIENKQWTGTGLFVDETTWKSFGDPENIPSMYQKKVYRFFSDEIYTEDGLMRANGTISTSAAYIHTSPIQINGISKLYLHVKLVGETATSFFPIVVWLDDGGNVVGYVDCTAGEGDYVLTPPAGAVAAVFNSLRTFVTQTDNVVCHADIVSAQPFAARVYISPDGSDTNSGLTADAPVLTMRRANTLLAADGELVMLAGDYLNLPIDLSNYGRLTGTGRVRCISCYRVTAAETAAGYTRVLCATIDKPPTRGTYLWQHDVADAATAILPSEVHPAQEGTTHRLPSTRIYPASSIAEIEASTDVLKWYVSGTTLYFSKAEGTDLATHPVVIPRRTISGTVGGTTAVRNVAFLYAPLLLTGMHGLLENVSVGMVNAAGAIRYDGTTDFLMRRCEAYGCSNDGFNGHGTADSPSDIVLENCWGHDNSDDGESCHEHCTVTSRGGLYEYNGSGCTPASGGRAAYYGTMARKNLPTHAWTGSSREGTGFSAQGAAAQGAQTAMHCHGCYSTANSIGIRTTLATGTHAIGCISTGNGTDYAGNVERIEQ